MKKEEGETRLPEAWQRLELICRRLWDADSPTAVDLQALIEEFKGETHRAEQTLSRMRKLHGELRETVTKEVQRSCSDELRTLQAQLKNAQERAAALDASSARKDERIESLLKELAAKEAVNLEFHEKFLASTAEADEARAQKMDSFYKELMRKESELESRWEARHVSLETEHKQRTESFKRRHEGLLDELKARAASMEEHYSNREQELEKALERFRSDREAWETARLSETQAMAKRKEELVVQADNLAGEYKKKQAELQKIKESLQAELAEVVRQYQARMRGPGA
jgi:chromosome segregation ATPase